MDEENKQEQGEDNASEDSGEGVQSETTSELDRADQIAERQKRENDRKEILLDREEALAARKAVGGGSEAGKPVEKKEKTPLEYADEIMANEN